MLFRCLIGILWMAILSLPAQADSAEALTQTAKATPAELAETVFELERSVAILQVSTASLYDYQALAEKLASQQALQDRVDFLSNLSFVLVVALLLLAWRLHSSQKILAKLSQSSKES